jgi:D-alanyl-D-alanine carboxypeptidase (penicillin-binding protein 5/6)
VRRRPPSLPRAFIAALAVAFALAAVPASAPAAPPRISGDAAILVQPDTEDVAFRDHATQRLPIASTTKLMTALLTLENADLDDTVKAVDYHASPLESLMGLRGGEKVTIHDLMEGLLLASGNDAATTLAVRVGGSEKRFVAMMNARARELGLRNTHYANPVGLDASDNYSSAEDLAKLALVLLQKPFFARTVDRKSAEVDMGGREHTIVNRNTLVRTVPWMDGVKTGHTSVAGYILVGAAKRHGVRLVSAVLGTPSEAARDADTLALMKWGLKRYKRTTALKRDEQVATTKLDFRDQSVPVVAGGTVRAVVRRGIAPRVRVSGVPDELSGAHSKGDRVGTVTVTYRGRTLAKVPALLGDDVPAASVTDKVSSALPPLWLVGLVAVGAIGSLLLAFRHRRRVRRRRARSRRRGGTETA